MQEIIPFPWSLWLGLGIVLITVFLSTAELLLGKLSPGVIHRLEENDAGMAATLDAWWRQREELRISLRVLYFFLSIAGFLCLISWFSYSPLGIVATWLPAGLAIAVYLFVPEIIAFSLPGTGGGRFLVAVMPVVRLLTVIVFPLSWPLVRGQEWVEEYWENTEKEEERATMEDEIRSLIEQDEAEADTERGLESDERRMIRGIFDLDDTLVKEIMTPRIDVRAIEVSGTLQELKALVVESGHSRIPVYRQSIDHIIGLIYAKDLIGEHLDNGQPLAQLQELLHPPVFLPETKNVGDLLAEFQQNRSHFAVVIDEYGGTEGVVTLEDIIEEIVGEIHDEYDEDPRSSGQLHQRPDGVIEVDGRFSIYELNQQYNLNLPEDEDYDTVGGCVSALLGRIPRPGEVVIAGNGRVTVMEADRRRILKAEIELLSGADKPAAAEKRNFSEL